MKRYLLIVFFLASAMSGVLITNIILDYTGISDRANKSGKIDPNLFVPENNWLPLSDVKVYYRCDDPSKTFILGCMNGAVFHPVLLPNNKFINLILHPNRVSVVGGCIVQNYTSCVYAIKDITR